MKHSKDEVAESMASLRESLKPGDTVTSVIRSVSRSGMSRTLDVYKFEVSGEHWKTRDNGVRTLWLTFHVARVLGLSRPRDGDALRVDGCGMDMGFHICYSLSARLWPDGFVCIGEGCPSNDHTNGDRNYSPTFRGKPHVHRDGGYALQHRWL